VNDEGSSIIVTTSGMLTGGPVIYYLSKLAGNSTNKVILVGYQAEGTPGRALQEGVKKLRLDKGKITIDVQLSVDSEHLSAHADRPQLETMIKKVNGLKTLFIMHGEKSKSEELREDMANRYRSIVPKNEETFEV
jgi:predicted metal-dependent RNase